MRKRNIIKIADTVFWYVLYILPVLGYICFILSIGRNPAIAPQGGLPNFSAIVSIDSYMSYSGLNVLTSNDNIVFTTLNSLFSHNGILPSLSSTAIRLFTWFVSVFIAHLMVDVLLFIPRFAMKWMDEFTKE